MPNAREPLYALEHAIRAGDPLERLRRAENSVLRAELDRLHNFSLTPGQVKRLPGKLRNYIHRLETIADPAGDSGGDILPPGER